MAASSYQTERVDLAVVGMAASFADAASLPDYWHAIINDAPASRAAGATEAAHVESALQSLTRKLVGATCEDAGHTARRPARERARLALAVVVPAALASRFENRCDVLTSRVAAEFNFDSARVLVETRGSARPLAAIKPALEELRGGVCDALLVAAVGEGGGGALLLKRLAGARRSGERVYAVVKEVSLRAREGPGEGDGRAVAFDCADVTRGSCPAGVLGLIRAALALYDKVLPPSSTSPDPTSRADASAPGAGRRARPWIHGEGRGPRRASLYESRQAGETAQLVLEEWAEPATRGQKLLDGGQPAELFCLSAESRAELLALVSDVEAALAAHAGKPLSHLAYTLALRASGPHRLALLAGDAADLRAKLETAKKRLSEQEDARWQIRGGVYYARPDAGEPPSRVAFMFPGYGSYYPWMFADLCRHFPPVRVWFDTLDGIFDERDGPLPSQLLFPTDGPAQGGDSLHGVRGGGEAGFTATLALHELLQNLGVRCDAMVGHSNGENVSLIASGTMRFETRAGVFDLTRRATIILDEGARGGDLPTGVFLGAGGCAPDFVARLLDASAGRLRLALDNCPHQVVLFGGESEVDDAAEQIRKAGGIALRLPFERAFHTPSYKAQAERLRPLYDSLDFGPGHTLLYSCATARPFPAEADEIRELAVSQWSSTVRFRETILELYGEGVRTFIEVGPSSTLTGFVSDTLRDKEHLSLASNTQRLSGLEQLQRLLARLYVGGMDLNLEYLYRFRDVGLIALPSAINARRAERPPTLPLATGTVGNGRRAESAAQTQAATATAAATTIAAVPAQSQQCRQVRPSAAPPATQAGARSAIIDGHFELMRLFLANQSRALASFFPRMAAAQTGPQFSIHTPDSVERDHAAPERWPLLGEIVERDGRRLRCRRRFDLRHDTFLLDHTLGRRADGRQALHPPLPIMPFTVSMEILAEAASCLLGGEMSVVGLRRVRGHRWLALERDALVLDAVAELQPPHDGDTQDVRVQVFEVRPDGREELSFEGSVSLARRYPPPPSPLQTPLAATLPVDVRAEDFYDHLTFHGPCFQGIKRLRAWNGRAIEVEMEVPPAATFFAAPGEALFQVPAALLDNTGQLVGLWLIEQGQREFAVFPFHAASFEQYRAPLTRGSRLLCRASMRLRENATSEADFEFIDDANRPVARLTGLQLKNSFGRHLPKILLPQTASSYFSDPWLQAETGLACRRIDAATLSLLEDERGVWKRALARQSLTAREREFWSQLPEKGTRRAEWLAGRVAAKDAVRQWAAERLGLALAPEEIEIDADEQGRPLALCAAWEGAGARPHISISHSRGDTAATAADAPVGIDVETLGAGRDEGWLLGVLGEGELALVARRDTPTLLALWCAKESAAKAAGTGLRADPRAWRIVGCSRGCDRVRVAHESGSFDVEIWQRDGAVFALARPINPSAAAGDEALTPTTADAAGGAVNGRPA